MQLHSNPPAPTQKSSSPSPEINHESFASQALTQLLSKAAEAADAPTSNNEDRPSTILQSSSKRWINQANENRKAAAAQRVAQLKDLVKALKQMILLASPEDAAALARQLKRIAGQLKSAVAQYAQAGGSSSGGGATGAISAPAAPADNGNPQASDLQQTSTAIQASTTATAHQATKLDSATTEPTHADAATSASSAPQNRSAAAQSGTEQSNRQRDEMFLADVNYIKNALKQMARLIEQKMRQDDPAQHELQQLRKELKEVDQLAQDIRSGQSTDMLATRVQNIQAAYSANLTTGAVSSVQVNIATPVVNVAT